MYLQKKTFRALFFLFLLTCLVSGLVGVVRAPVNAAPLLAPSTTIVISQVYGGGGNSGAPYTNDFIELFNLGSSPVPLSGWSVQYGGATGTTWAVTPLTNVSIAPGRYYLIEEAAGAGGTAALPTPDASDITNMNATAGKVALVNTTTALSGACPIDASIIDFIGYGTVNCSETVNAPALSATNADLRGANECIDTDNNSSDFVKGAPNPRNNTPAFLNYCLRVTNVTSLSNGIYTTGSVIDITITFSGVVNVTGIPTLLLANGATGTSAPYISGDGSNILTFEYTVAAGDFSADLDYVAINSLALNGGTINDAVGDANLILPSPGTPGSLGFNSDIVIDNGVAPTVTVDQAVGQTDPASTLPIKFTVVFSKPIDPTTFTIADITQNGTASGIIWSITNSGDNKTFTLSATALTGIGNLIPAIAANLVKDLGGNNNLASTSTDNSVTYTNGNAPLTVIINEVAWMGTGASSGDEWIELYNPGAVDIDLGNWILKADDNTPNIKIPAGKIIKSHGYFLLERDTDDTVIDVKADVVYPTGTLNSSYEVLRLYDPANRIIDTANSNSGLWPAGFMNNTTTYGTMERRGVIADSDTAWITNVNSASWMKHDARCTVVPASSCLATYLIHGTPGYANWAYSVQPTPSPRPTNIPPTPTRPFIPAPPPPLIGINEFVPRAGHDWNNDGLINTGDEYIELLNHGVIDVNLGGYSLDDEANVGSTPYRLPSVVLKPGQRMVFYGKDTGLLLGDGGDGVRLLKPNGQLGDAYNYTVVKYPDQSYCRLPDNGGLDDWNQNCFPTPGLQNALSGAFARPPTEKSDEEPLCPIADNIPLDFAWAECPLFGNIWSRFYWDKNGWFGEKNIPANGKWDVYVD